MEVIESVSRPVWFPIDPTKQGMWYGNFFVIDKKEVIHRLVYEVIEWTDMDTGFIYYDAQEIPSHMDELVKICASYFEQRESCTKKEARYLTGVYVKAIRKQLSECLTRYLENRRSKCLNF